LKEQLAPWSRLCVGLGVASFVGVALACGGLSALCVGLLPVVGGGRGLFEICIASTSILFFQAM